MNDLIFAALLGIVALIAGHLGGRLDRHGQAIPTERVCWREAIRRGAGR